MSWNDYVNAYLLNNTDSNTGNTATNVCQHGAIVGNGDGTVWASSPGFGLSQYNLEVEQENGTKKTVNVNEFKNLVDAFDNKGTTNAVGGIRIHNEKYFPVSFDEDKKLLYLKKSGGGACVGKSNLAFVIGTFSSKLTEKDYNGKNVPQNPGHCNLACEKLVEFLTNNNL
jgi:hypothetical protein